MSEDTTDDAGEGTPQGRDRLGEASDRAVSEFDDRAVDILSWVLDTETRARIYVHLRKQPWSTSDEVATGTGLYPSTVREALADLADEGTVERRKRENEGAGNNPYEYTAIPPSDLVGGVVGQIQDELNALCNLDGLLGGDDEPQSEPVSIQVEASDDGTADEGDETDPKR